MWKKLNGEELNDAIVKIREKYRTLIKEFKKPPTLLEAFETRYINALKSKIDLSTFIMAEIEATKELYDKESLKRKELEQKRLENQKRSSVTPDFADKILFDNLQKIEKYESVSLSPDADHEMERFFGAVRFFLNNYWPIITYIYSGDVTSSTKQELNHFYNKLVGMVDYKGDVPIAKSYLYALNRVPRDQKRADQERQIIYKELSFLLNDIFSIFQLIIKEDIIPYKNRLIDLGHLIKNPFLKEKFQGVTFKAGFEKVEQYLNNMILDFRIKDLKRGG